MIAIAKSSASRRPAPAWHTQFLAMLPGIEMYAAISFRSAPLEAKADLIQEVIANAVVAFIRLVALDKADLAYPTVLAKYAVAQVRHGRRVGSQLNIQDALSQYAQHRQGFSVDRLDHYDVLEGGWQEILLEDRRCTPADLAASRIDFADWLQRLPSRQRRIAKVLASGERTCEVAKRFGMSAGRISQIRDELRESWEKFQGEAQPTPQSGCAAA